MAEFDSNEGILLALSAQNEVLNKLDSTISKMLRKAEEDEEAEAKKKEEEEEAEKFEKMVSAVTKAIAAKGAFLKKDDTKESKPTFKTKPEEVQLPIQAAEDEIEDKKGLERIAIEKGDMTGKNPDATEPAKAEDVEGKDKKDEKKDEYPEVEEMKKAIASLTSELEKMKKGYDTDVKKAVEDRLSKTGWREEKSLVAPKKTLGVESEPLNISKSASEEERIDQLRKLDYGTLRKLEEKQARGELSPEFNQLLGGR